MLRLLLPALGLLFLPACSSGGGGGDFVPAPIGGGPGGPLVPDLVVDSLTLTPAMPSKNEEFQVAVVVRNAGSDYTGNFLVNLHLSDGGAEEVDLDSDLQALVAGDTAVIDFIVTPVDLGGGNFALAGPVTITVTADSGGTVAESDETNNTLVEVHTIVDALAAKPDLSIEFGTPIPAVPAVDGTVITPFTLSNTGSVATGPFTLRCRVFDRFGLEMFAWTVVDTNVDIANGGSQVFNYTWEADAGIGPYQVLIEADIDDVVDELIESNNVETLVLPIGGVI